MLEVVDAFSAEQRTDLDSLAGRVTGTDATRVVNSMDLLHEIEFRIDGLRSHLDECGGEPATSLDALGPLPRRCVARHGA